MAHKNAIVSDISPFIGSIRLASVFMGDSLERKSVPAAVINIEPMVSAIKNASAFMGDNLERKKVDSIVSLRRKITVVG